MSQRLAPSGTRLTHPGCTSLFALTLGALAAGCNTGAPGSPCASDAECRASRCLPAITGRGVCMSECVAGTRLCADGAVCLDVGGTLACYLGGTHAIGDTCATDLECEPGTVCPPSIGACVQGCLSGMDGPCRMSERCEDGPTGGICRERPDAGEPDAGAGP